MSLAVPYRPDSGSVGGYAGTLVRLSIGLEDADDLIRDLEQALAKLAASVGA
jgi:cystathionine beta-lyase/cystathionine gamma-synthase